MNATITANGKTYQRRAWTGGEPPPPEFPRQDNRDEWELVQAFYTDSYRCWQENVQPAGPLPTDVHQIFMNRARHDAWATMRE